MSADCGWCRVEEICRGVYAVIDLDGGWFLSNTGLIDMGDYTLVVDTQYNKARASDVLAVIRGLGLPGDLLVINTHHHGDHAWGNHVFGGYAVMQEGAAEALRALAPLAPDMYKPFFPYLDFTGSRYTEPRIVFRHQLVLRGPRGSVTLRHAGPAHTVGDTVVDIGWCDAVLLGDLLFNGVTPLALDGTVEGWARLAGEMIDRYEGKTLIGGHGPPGTTRELGLIKRYLEHVLQGAKDNLGEGVEDPLEIATRIGPGPLEGWSIPERLVLNVARAIMDLKGEPPGAQPPDLAELALKMREYVKAQA